MNSLYMSLKQLGELLCTVLKVVDLLFLLHMFCFETVEDVNYSELFNFFPQVLDTYYILIFARRIFKWMLIKLSTWSCLEIRMQDDITT